MTETRRPPAAGPPEPQAPRVEVRPKRGDRVWLEPKGRPRELRSRSRRGARAAAWVTIALVTIGTALWARTTWALLAPCDRVTLPEGQLCQAQTAWIWRAMQFPVAVAGIVAGFVGLVYLVYFTVTGRTFRRWRSVAKTFAALVVVWLVIYAIGAFDGTQTDRPENASGGDQQHPLVAAGRSP